jgi:hypothetical protein
VHLEFLNERVKSFTKDLDSYEVETKDDWQTAKVFVHGEPVPAVEEWGPIIGDVVHNLRSALDHLVWQLTIANGHTPPNPIPVEADRVASGGISASPSTPLTRVTDTAPLAD